MDIDKFVSGYITCALWSSTDNADESGGEPLDANYDQLDINITTLEQMCKDCADFIEANAADLEEYAEVLGGGPDEHAGHDFWLTRNGHGEGFWDRGLGELGDRLTAAAHACGECDLYVGDDGRLYIL